MRKEEADVLKKEFNEDTTEADALDFMSSEVLEESQIVLEFLESYLGTAITDYCLDEAYDLVDTDQGDLVRTLWFSRGMEDTFVCVTPEWDQGNGSRDTDEVPGERCNGTRRINGRVMDGKDFRKIDVVLEALRTQGVQQLLEGESVPDLQDGYRSVLAREYMDSSRRAKANEIRKRYGLKWGQVKFKADRSSAGTQATAGGRVDYASTTTQVSVDDSGAINQTAAQQS